MRKYVLLRFLPRYICRITTELTAMLRLRLIIQIEKLKYKVLSSKSKSLKYKSRLQQNKCFPFALFAVNSLSYKLLTPPTALIIKGTENDKYAWLSFFRNSISQTLLYLKKFIRSLGHLALDQSRKLSVSLFSISRIFANTEQIFRSLE